MDFLFGQNFQRAFAVVSGADVVAIAHEVKAQHLAQRTVILYDKDRESFR